MGMIPKFTKTVLLGVLGLVVTANAANLDKANLIARGKAHEAYVGGREATVEEAVSSSAQQCQRTQEVTQKFLKQLNGCLEATQTYLELMPEFNRQKVLAIDGLPDQASTKNWKQLENTPKMLGERIALSDILMESGKMEAALITRMRIAIEKIGKMETKISNYIKLYESNKWRNSDYFKKYANEL